MRNWIRFLGDWAYAILAGFRKDPSEAPQDSAERQGR